MHRFLRAIGFSNINSRKDMDKLIGIIMDQPKLVKKADTENDSTYTEITKEFAPHTGITLRGDYDKLGFFPLDLYFPYCESTVITSHIDTTINKRVDTNAFTGMCDDLRLGISLIFYLQNAIDYMKLHCQDNIPKRAKLSLSGLSLQGCILLGIDQTEAAKEKHNYDVLMRSHLIAKARNGDQEAIDNLTIDEIDLSSRINKRIKHEDLYSIVETTFIPYGSESDNYSIIGTILKSQSFVNPYTNEEIYQLLIDCNDIILNVSINKLDLVGEPAADRRFKGTIWMQGHADFPQI